MRRHHSIARRALFAVLLIVALLMIAITVPADQIMPANPLKQVDAQKGEPILPPSNNAAEEETPVVEIAIAPAVPTYNAAIDEQLDDREMDILEEDTQVDEPDGELNFIDSLIEDAYLSDDSLTAVNGMTHILLIGLDARPGEKTGRSDTMIILTLDAEHKCIKMISLMRDLYVEIPGHKSNRLNSAYYKGGAQLLMDTIKQNFNIEIDHYVAVNFSVLADVIDQLGGLTLDVQDKYVPRINAIIKEDNKVLKKSTNDGLIKKGGTQLLTGKQAQAYARYRFGTSDGDFGRTVRQREVILKALDKIQALSMTDMVKLAMNNMDKLTTDMSIIDMIRLAPAAFELRNQEVKQLRIPVDKGYESKTISGMSVLVPDRSKNRLAINEFLLK